MDAGRTFEDATGRSSRKRSFEWSRMLDRGNRVGFVYAETGFSASITLFWDNRRSFFKGLTMMKDDLTRANASDFELKLQRLQAGDSSAISDFVATYEPYIRRTIRFRLKQSSLSPVADSVDVCQSVLSGFLLRLSTGEYNIRSEDDLRRLLFTITKKKFLMLQRREFAAKRSRKQTQSLNDLPEPIQSPAQNIEYNLEVEDLWELAFKLMSPEERELIERRKNGQCWEKIGSDLNISPMLLRKRLSRTLRRVANELGLDY